MDHDSSKGKYSPVAVAAIVLLICWALSSWHPHEIGWYLYTTLAVASALFEWATKSVLRTVKLVWRQRSRLRLRDIIWFFVAFVIICIPVSAGFFAAGKNYFVDRQRDYVLLVGDMETYEGFGRSTREFIEQNKFGQNTSSHWPRVDYLHIKQPSDGSRSAMAEYEETLYNALVKKISTAMPLAIVSLDTSTTVSALLNQANKWKLPVIVAAATKAGIVDYEHNCIRVLPPNLAQANAMAKQRRELIDQAHEHWALLKRIEADAFMRKGDNTKAKEIQEQLTAWSNYKTSWWGIDRDAEQVAKLAEQEAIAEPDLVRMKIRKEKEEVRKRLNDALNERAKIDSLASEKGRLLAEWNTAHSERCQEIDKRVAEIEKSLASSLAEKGYMPTPAVRPPRVVFGFIHDGSDFGVDLKGHFLGLSPMDPPSKTTDDTIVVFDASTETEIVQAVTLGKQNGVSHWFVGLYEKRAQDFNRALGVLDRGVGRSGVTYCDAAYGHWMFSTRERNASVLLPVYRPIGLDRKVAHPFYIRSPAKPSVNEEPRLLPSLSRRESCYGPFAVDAISLIQHIREMHLDHGKGTFSQFFYENVVERAAKGLDIDNPLGIYTQVVRTYRYEDIAHIPTDVPELERKQIMLMDLASTPSEFAVFKIGGVPPQQEQAGKPSPKAKAQDRH